MLPLVDADWQRLAQARIAARRDTEGLQYLINTVPASLKGDPGLAYERYLYRVTKGRWQDAEDFILERVALGRRRSAGPTCGWSGAPTSPGRRSRTATWRPPTGSPRGTSAPAAPTTRIPSGWPASSRSPASATPKTAVEHFRRFRAAVATPISLGRAGYWLGLAYEEAGDEAAAQAAFRAGARHQTSFYGQLAAEKLASPPDAAPRRHRHPAEVAQGGRS